MLASRLDEIVRDHAHVLGEVREALGAERARREMAEERARALEAQLALLTAHQEELRESPETVAEMPMGPEPQEAREGAQEPAQPQGTPRSW